jgi:hypothetical protein
MPKNRGRKRDRSSGLAGPAHANHNDATAPTLPVSTAVSTASVEAGCKKNKPVKNTNEKKGGKKKLNGTKQKGTKKSGEKKIKDKSSTKLRRVKDFLSVMSEANASGNGSESRHGSHHDDDDDLEMSFGGDVDVGSDPVSEAFFELANADEVVMNLRPNFNADGQSGGENPSVTVDGENSSSSAAESKSEIPVIRIKQDLTQNLQHSGGIVWETSYLLAEWFSQRYGGRSKRGGNTVRGKKSGSRGKKSGNSVSSADGKSEQKSKQLESLSMPLALPLRSKQSEKTTDSKKTDSAAKTQILEVGAGCGYLGCRLGLEFPEAEVRIRY